MTYVLAVDMGASGGRHILAHLEEGKIVLEEIYRFDNVMVERNGHLCWQMDRLWEHVLKGMAACKAAGKIPVSMGIDTWGVDYVLLDQAGQVLGDTVAYRDSRTQGMDAKLEQTMPFTELYRRTGIAKQPFNTVYQLMATPREQLDQAQDFLMIPDYLHYRLTGRKANEYTEASTTGMLNSVTRDWDQEVLAAAERAQCGEFLKRLEKGIYTMAGDGGKGLSGGERQRIALARAILKDAPIVVLDEATAFLDPENEEKMNAAIAEVIRGKTVIVIAHRLQSIAGADQIVVLDQGNVAGIGRHDTLRKTCPAYEKLWRAAEGAAAWRVSAEKGGDEA